MTYYVEGEDDLLVAAFEHTFSRVNERASHAIGDLTGLEAIRLLCLETLPLDEERRVESRVAAACWDRPSARLRKVHADAVATWRTRMARELEAARRAGSVVSDLPDSRIIDEFLAVATASRVVPTLEPGSAESPGHVERLDAIIAGLGGPAG